MAWRQALMYVALGSRGDSPDSAALISELPGFAVSVLSLVAVLILWQMLVEREKASAEIERSRHHSHRLEKAEALARLAGGIAHDFNNMLAGIVGHTELAAREAGEASPARRHLEETLRAADRAQQLVDRVLAFEHGPSGSFAAVSLETTIRDVLRLIEPTLARGVSTACHVETGSEWVRGDASQIHRLLLNVCTNGVQAMHKRGGRLDVTVDSVDASSYVPLEGSSAGRYARVRVSDEGDGIRTEERPQVFDPYYTTKRDQGHSGLGLWVARAVAETHGGLIFISDSPSRPSTVEILLPHGAISVSAAPETSEAGSKHRDRSTPRAGEAPESGSAPIGRQEETGTWPVYSQSMTSRAFARSYGRLSKARGTTSTKPRRALPA